MAAGAADADTGGSLDDRHRRGRQPATMATWLTARSPGRRAQLSLRLECPTVTVSGSGITGQSFQSRSMA